MLQLNPVAFNNFLFGIGQECTWRRAYTCPCLNPASGSAQVNCPRCRGKGRFWEPNAIETVIGVANQKTQLEWAKLGLWESGDSIMVIPENSVMYEIGQFDRVVMLNSTDPFSKVFKHGAPTERLLLQVQQFTRLFWMLPDGTLVEGKPPVLAADGTMSWPGGDGEPPPGMQYTLNGTAYSEYYCFGPFASDRNEHRGARLPKRLVMRKWDLFDRGNRPAV